jgi:hypothetical protein
MAAAALSVGPLSLKAICCCAGVRNVPTARVTMNTVSEGPIENFQDDLIVAKSPFQAFDVLGVSTHQPLFRNATDVMRLEETEGGTVEKTSYLRLASETATQSLERPVGSPDPFAADAARTSRG